MGGRTIPPLQLFYQRSIARDRSHRTRFSPADSIALRRTPTRPTLLTPDAAPMTDPVDEHRPDNEPADGLRDHTKDFAYLDRAFRRWKRRAWITLAVACGLLALLAALLARG